MASGGQLGLSKFLGILKKVPQLFISVDDSIQIVGGT